MFTLDVCEFLFSELYILRAMYMNANVYFPSAPCLLLGAGQLICPVLTRSSKPMVVPMH